MLTVLLDARPTVRTTVLRHTALIIVVALVLSALVTLGVWLVAQAEARRTAERVATQVAAAVLVPLTARDYAQPLDRADLLRDVDPFLRSGVVHRVKVWRVDGDQVEIVFSDESRIESARRHADPGLGRRLGAGETAVFPVPDDPEHRFEIAQAGELLEVFIGFRDAGGHPARLEIYVPVDIAGTTRAAVAVMLPIALGGLLLLGSGMLALSVALARRIDRDRRERADTLHYGLAASELARRDLARWLHDDVIPDLAGAGLLLDTAAGSGSGELVGRARTMIGEDVRRMRALLTEFLPDQVTGETFAASVRALAAGADLRVDAMPVVGDDAATLLHRVARELLHNAGEHAGASRVLVRLGADGAGAVRLEVVDDGRGFDPGRPPPPGHVGLLLVRRVVEEAGGTVIVTSAPGAGTAVSVAVPASLRLPGRVHVPQ
ncbi:sensor histidine kinase [Pseudonocardia abyssalis]|uniref:Histidine kinase domain-containing protein n=1 Tax=Pseudonocardia abyssalis TaxID=2792008 RepID=A0ABS6UR08_9PSEU|nr:ATP-binding protein [Pseudonocardia abyssalis]MBW0115043.1 hypothetical protein [Pseudonocardia abyssalis]MBW0134692.1 hypothetical protein [Pseudonocardia abyssalis]